MYKGGFRRGPRQHKKSMLTCFDDGNTSPVFVGASASASCVHVRFPLLQRLWLSDHPFPKVCGGPLPPPTGASLTKLVRGISMVLTIALQSVTLSFHTCRREHLIADIVCPPKSLVSLLRRPKIRSRFAGLTIMDAKDRPQGARPGLFAGIRASERWTHYLGHRSEEHYYQTSIAKDCGILHSVLTK